MDVKVLSEEENKLFNRKEARFEVIHEGEPTPKLVDIRLSLSQKTGNDLSGIIIDELKTLYGIGRTMGRARMYKNLTELREYEPEYLIKRNGLIPKQEGGSEDGQKEESSS